MRAVKCKDNQLSLINKFETQLYDQAKMLGDLKLIELSERDAYLADEMHKKNIFQWTVFILRKLLAKTGQKQALPEWRATAGGCE